MRDREMLSVEVRNALRWLLATLALLLGVPLLIGGAFVGALYLAHGGTAARPHGHSFIVSATGIDVTGTTVVWDVETHGGFHGDGETYVVLSFDDDRALDAIQSNPSWKPLPLSENLSLLVHGRQTDVGIRRVPLTWRMLDLEAEDTPLFPDCDQGYYLFIDRHSRAATGSAMLSSLPRLAQLYARALRSRFAHIVLFRRRQLKSVLRTRAFANRPPGGFSHRLHQNRPFICPKRQKFSAFSLSVSDFKVLKC